MSGAAAVLTVSGWLPTGDQGYLLEGDELVVTGRTKEVVVINGRTIGATEIERAATVAGVRPGSVIAFGVRHRSDTDGVVVVAECRTPAMNDRLRGQVRGEVKRQLGVSPVDVVLLERGQIPKTTSGKLQRVRCRALYEQGALGSSI